MLPVERGNAVEGNSICLCPPADDLERNLQKPTTAIPGLLSTTRKAALYALLTKVSKQRVEL